MCLICQNESLKGIKKKIVVESFYGAICFALSTQCGGGGGRLDGGGGSVNAGPA